MHEHDRAMREGRWRLEDRLTPQPSLTGRRLGIVGLGHIGKAIARRAEPFKLQVGWWGPRPKDAPWPMAESLLALAEASDVLMVAGPGGPETQGLVSREVIEAVGPQGMIVNVARGSVVDEDALIAALKAGRLRRAALDVFQEEPTPAGAWPMPGSCSPRTAPGAPPRASPTLMGLAVENICCSWPASRWSRRSPETMLGVSLGGGCRWPRCWGSAGCS